MDNPMPPREPKQLLDDLESIRELLGDDSLEPPLLTEEVADDFDDIDDVPLLSETITEPPQQITSKTPLAKAVVHEPGTISALRQTVQESISRDSEMNRLDSELRAAAQLILQDVIDDFVPQIEAELRTRLEARLSRLLPPRKP
ncbi:DNA polymerase III subunit chi [Pseudomonas marincola]|uniref:DNA polymerase III subunit chi n=1 Tax=Pseudomonas marincola TaxID=437900 RepID=A0A653E4H4_9PSED|nr:DNA polymerase III subunit chi [Pseudomonas marincola]CAE6896834.1 DNA polymerase III subunit chi [Pseudomonas marincola]